MATFRIDLINRYLKPHKRTLFLGAISLVLVNIFSVAIPFEVRRIIDTLQEECVKNYVLYLLLKILIEVQYMEPQNNYPK